MIRCPRALTEHADTAAANGLWVVSRYHFHEGLEATADRRFKE